MGLLDLFLCRGFLPNNVAELILFDGLRGVFLRVNSKGNANESELIISSNKYDLPSSHGMWARSSQQYKSIQHPYRFACSPLSCPYSTQSNPSATKSQAPNHAIRVEAARVRELLPAEDWRSAGPSGGPPLRGFWLTPPRDTEKLEQQGDSDRVLKIPQ